MNTTNTALNADPAAGAPAATQPNAAAAPSQPAPPPSPSVTMDAANLSQQPVTPEASPSAQPDPFNFIGASGKENEAVVSSLTHASPPDANPDYSIDFGPGYRGSDSEREFLTSTAHKHNISAESASGFFRDAIDYYTAQVQEHNQTELKALQDLWGADFDRRMGRAASELDNFCRNLGISPDQASAYMSPEAFFLVDYFVSRLSESRAVGTKSAAVAATGKAAYESMMSDPAIADILANPNHPQYRAIADRANRALGSDVY